MTSRKSITLSEILGQEAGWRQAVQACEAARTKVAALLRSTEVDMVIFTGCGSSYYLAMTAAAFFQETTGLPARAVPASELILTRDSHLTKGARAALIGFSRSGETSETVVALRLHRDLGTGPVIAVTCRDDSSMGNVSDLHLSLPAAADKSVVMTASFTSMLLAATLITAVVARDDGVFSRLRDLPNKLGRVLPQQAALAEKLGADGTITRFIFLGIGPFLGLAHEGMLKMKEMTQQQSEAYSPLEFRHGPMSIIEPGTLVVLLASRRAADQEMHVLQDTRRFGASTLSLGFAADGQTADWSCDAGQELSEIESAVLSVPLMQLLAYYRAQTLGRDPDRPQHLTQVVVLDQASLLRGVAP